MVLEGEGRKGRVQVLRLSSKLPGALLQAGALALSHAYTYAYM